MGSVLSTASATSDSAIAADDADDAVAPEPTEHDGSIQQPRRIGGGTEYRVPIAAVMDLAGAALRHYSATNKAGAGFVPIEPSMAAFGSSCCGPCRLGFWARRSRRSDEASSARSCRRRRNIAPPLPEKTASDCCFYTVMRLDRLSWKTVVKTCIIVGEPPRLDPLTDKQLRPNKKKHQQRRQGRDMEYIRAFCPSYKESLQINRTDEQVFSEEEERHSHCC